MSIYKLCHPPVILHGGVISLISYQKVFAPTSGGLTLQTILGSVINGQLVKDRQVQPMPWAFPTNKNGEGFWKRTEVVLGKLAVPGYNGNLELEAKPLVAGYFFTTVVLLAPLLNIYQQKCRNE